MVLLFLFELCFKHKVGFDNVDLKIPGRNTFNILRCGRVSETAGKKGGNFIPFLDKEI